MNDEMNCPLVSIILRTWNAPRFLRVTYDSLIHCTNYNKYELIIVDDNSQQETIDLLLTLSPDVLILNKKKVGAPKATEQGTKLANGKYIAIVDSDVIFSPNWLTRLINELESKKGHLISAARFKNLDYPDNDASLRYVWNIVKEEFCHLPPYELFLTYSKGRSLSEFEKAVLGPSYREPELVLTPPDCVGTSCVVYDRDFVDNRAGGFLVDNFFPYSGDDVDLSWRIGMKNGIVMRSRSVLVHHFEHASIKDSKLDVEFSVKKNNVKLFSKWGGVLENFIHMQIEKGESLDLLVKKYFFLKIFLEYKRPAIKSQDIEP